MQLKFGRTLNDIQLGDLHFVYIYYNLFKSRNNFSLYSQMIG